jgi:hypothetical protein
MKPAVHSFRRGRSASKALENKALLNPRGGGAVFACFRARQSTDFVTCENAVVLGGKGLGEKNNIATMLRNEAQPWGSPSFLGDDTFAARTPVFEQEALPAPTFVNPFKSRCRHNYRSSGLSVGVKLFLA